MAFSILLPVVYTLRVSKTVTAAARRTSDSLTLAGAGAPFPSDPVDRPRATKSATPLYCLLAQLPGYLPAGVRAVVAGDLDDEQLRGEWDGRVGHTGHFRKLQNQIMTELYGPSSWFRTWVEGEVFADLLVVWVTNWDLEARTLEMFPPAQESPAEATARLDEVTRIRTAITTLRTRVKDQYRDAFSKAADKLTSSASTSVRARAERQKSLYRRLMDEDVRCLIPPGVPFASVAEIRHAKLIPLQTRDPATRRGFWREKMDADVVASYIGRGCEIVDIQATLRDPRFVAMYKFKLPRIADLLHQFIIYPDQLTQAMQKGLDDINVRMNFKIPTKTNEVYAELRKIGDKYLSTAANKPNPPRWQDLPVYNQRQALVQDVSPGEQDDGAPQEEPDDESDLEDATEGLGF